MLHVRSSLAHNGVAPKHYAGASAEAEVDVRDPTDLAIRERDDVEDGSVASFPASEPPSWWSGR
jgi:hypothetical protein